MLYYVIRPKGSVQYAFGGFWLGGLLVIVEMSVSRPSDLSGFVATDVRSPRSAHPTSTFKIAQGEE
jgi:hypothetical protein